jgi:hypothetical protein
MLDSSDKYILSYILYKQLSNLYTLTVVVNNLTIESVKYNEIITISVIFRNIWLQVNNFLNETKSNNINDTIQEWSNGLEDRVFKVYNESLFQLENIEFNDLQKKYLLLRKLFYSTLIVLVNSEINNNDLYLNNLELSIPIQFYTISKFIKNFLDSNSELEPIALQELLLADNRQIVSNIVNEILDTIKNPIFPLTLDNYL